MSRRARLCTASADVFRRHTIIRALGVVVMSDDIARRSPTASLRSHAIPRLVPVCGHGAWSASAESLSTSEQCATRGYHDRNLTDRRAGGSAGASGVIVIIKNEFLDLDVRRLAKARTHGPSLHSRAKRTKLKLKIWLHELLFFLFKRSLRRRSQKPGPIGPPYIAKRLYLR